MIPFVGFRLHPDRDGYEVVLLATGEVVGACERRPVGDPHRYDTDAERAGSWRATTRDGRRVDGVRLADVVAALLAVAGTPRSSVVL